MAKNYQYEIDLSSNGTAARLLRLVGENKSVLEMGCSNGSQTRILSTQMGCTVIGVEINPQAARDAEPFAERVIVGDIEKLDFEQELKGRTFDVITFADVLEHLYDPTATLSKLRPFLNSDGYVVATIPNFTHAAITFEMANGRFDYRKTGLLDDTHIRFFSRGSLYDTFINAGYQITNLSRSQVKAEHCEIAVQIKDDEDRAFLDYIRRRNPESESYHFIVKALPSGASTMPVVPRHELFAVEDLVRIKQDEIVRDEATIRHLKQNIRSITSTRGYLVLDWLRRFLS